MIIWKYVTNPKFLPAKYVIPWTHGLDTLNDLIDDRKYEDELECYSFGNCDGSCDEDGMSSCDDFNYYMQMLQNGLM